MRKHTLFAVGAVLIVMLALPAQADTLIEIDNVRPGELGVVGFEIDSPIEVMIEGVGLARQHSSQLAAYGWLLDAETREPVWVMKSRFSERMRSESPLRRAEKLKALEPGKYELYYFADDGWWGSFNFSGNKDFIGFLGDIFGDEEYDDYDYNRMLTKDCFVRLTSEEATESDLKFYEPDGDIENAILQYNRLGDGEYIRQGFKLDRPMTINVYSVIEHPKGYSEAVDYGWILNAETREKVWQMDRFTTERAGGDKKNRMFKGEVDLPAGEYVLYFVTDDSHSFREFNTNPPYDPLNWGITLLPGENFQASAFHMVDYVESKPVIDLSRARDGDYLEQAFKLEQDTEVRVYAIGEFSFGGREFVDYGWIQEAGRGQTVWEMEYDNTEHAGGAEKNRMFDGVVRLPKGEYVAAYVTDGSHSYTDWNSARPFDPPAWGLQIFPAKDVSRDAIALMDRDELRRDEDVLASIVRVRDHERLRQRFTLEQATKVHIYALGEGQGGQMYDYGWIIDEESGRAVWEMTYRKTDHAGGAQKNRMVSDEIMLDAGDYEVVYVTDGSHSFNDWNATRPRDSQSWGITISVASDDRAER